MKSEVVSDFPVFIVDAVGVYESNGTKDKLFLGTQGVARDITERKLAEQSLREEERRYRRIIETSMSGFWLLDEKCRFLEVNDAYCRMSGYPREELLGGTISDVDAVESLEEIRRHMENLIAKGQDRFESVHRRWDGRLFHVDVSTTVISEIPLRMCAFIQDITDRKTSGNEREITIRLLKLINDSNNLHEFLESVTILMQEWTGCEAVGIRLKDGDDYPYFETRGFSAVFNDAENYLCSYDEDGELERDSNGNPVLECMCGNVIRGRFDPVLPFFHRVRQLLDKQYQRVACLNQRAGSSGTNPQPVATARAMNRLLLSPFARAKRCLAFFSSTTVIKTSSASK